MCLYRRNAFFTTTTHNFLCRNKEKQNEKNLSTQEKTKKQGARFPRKNEDDGRPQDAGEKKEQGTSYSFRLTGDKA